LSARVGPLATCDECDASSQHKGAPFVCRSTNSKPNSVLALFGFVALQPVVPLVEFACTISDLASWNVNEYHFSPSFYVDGYWFRLQASRYLGLHVPEDTKTPSRPSEETTVSLFLCVDNVRSLLLPILTIARIIRSLLPQPSLDTFHITRTTLGYRDIFHQP
jgi:hypothetical protein